MAEPTTSSLEPRPLPTRPKPPRAVVWFNIATIALLLAIITPLVWVSVSADSGLRPGSLIRSSIYPCLVLGLLWWFFRSRLVRRFLNPFSGFVCPRCHYPLSRLDDVGVCPECGTAFTRDSVVALWEQAYAFRSRFPRHAPITNAEDIGRLRDLATTPTAPVTTPWSSVSLDSTLQRIEASARACGFTSPRLPAYFTGPASSLKHLGAHLPVEFTTLYGWIDPALWTVFITRQPPANPPMTWLTDDTSFTPSVSLSPDPIRLLPPSESRSTTLSSVAGSSNAVNRFLGSLAELNRAADWPATRLIEFARTQDDTPVYLAPTPPEGPDGSILCFLNGEPDRVLLASSLTEWLARLAACDGHDAILEPASLRSLPEPIQAALIAEFEARHPHSRRFA